MRRLTALLAASFIVALAASAAAEEPKVNEVLPETKITLRPPRPAAAVTIARKAPQLGVRDLRRSAIDQIERPIARDPF